MHSILRRVGAVGAALSMAWATSALVAPSAQADTVTYPLHNTTAGQDSCPASVVGDAWHFVATPKSGTTIQAITLVLDGNTVAIDSWSAEPLPGDAYVAVPSGYSLTSLQGGTFAVSGGTARTKVNLSHTCGATSTPVEISPLVSVSKTAEHAAQQKYLWDIEKSVAKYTRNADKTVTVDYNLDVTRTADAAHTWSHVTGVITVSNDGSVPVNIASVGDDITGQSGEQCTLSSYDPALTAGATVDVSYSCDVPLMSAGADTNTATASYTWTAGTAGNTFWNAGSSSAIGSVDFTYAAPTQIDNTGTVSDGTTTWNLSDSTSVPLKYQATLTVGGDNCDPGYTNTASVTGDTTGAGDTSSVTVHICGSKGGKTIGYRFAKMTSQTRAWVTGVGGTTYPNVVGSIPAKSKSSDSALNSWFKAANCSGYCKTMFQAQFIATAMQAGSVAGWGAQQVIVPTQFDTDGAVDGCASINSLLAYGEANFTTMSTVDRVALKSIYDALNQDAGGYPTCG